MNFPCHLSTKELHRVPLELCLEILNSVLHPPSYVEQLERLVMKYRWIGSRNRINIAQDKRVDDKCRLLTAVKSDTHKDGPILECVKRMLPANRCCLNFNVTCPRHIDKANEWTAVIFWRVRRRRTYSRRATGLEDYQRKEGLAPLSGMQGLPLQFRTHRK